MSQILRSSYRVLSGLTLVGILSLLPTGCGGPEEQEVDDSSSMSMSLTSGRFAHVGSWTGAGYGSAPEGWYVGDFNGDGMDDIFRYLPGTSGADMLLSTGAGFTRVGSWTGAGYGQAPNGWYVGNFDGDCRADIFRYLPGTSGADMFLAQ